MKKKELKLTCISGIFAALVFVVTAYLHIPTYNGYVHVGDGFIYLVYDRERGAHYVPDFNYDYHAREILMARVTEEDILSGRLVNEGSYLQKIVNKLILEGKNDH